jgi:hypothetical protein
VTLTCPELTPANYTVWAIKVEAILDAQGVWEAVSPADGTMTVDEKKNKTARAQLLGALSEDILMHVSMKKTAKEVWDSLKMRFVGADRVKKARLSTLHGEFDKLYMAEEERLRRQDQRHGSEVREPRLDSQRRRHGEEAARHRARPAIQRGGRDRAILRPGEDGV